MGSGALALVQGMTDAGASPADGVWFVTRGGQIVARERTGTLAGALLWGLSSAVELEHAQLTPRRSGPGSGVAAAGRRPGERAALPGSRDADRTEGRWPPSGAPGESWRPSGAAERRGWVRAFGPGLRAAAGGPELPDCRGTRGNGARGRQLAGRRRGRSDRADRAKRARRAGAGRDRGAAGSWRPSPGGDRGRRRRRRRGGNARTHRDRPPPGRHLPRGRGSGGRGARESRLDPFRGCARAEGFLARGASIGRRSTATSISSSCFRARRTSSAALGRRIRRLPTPSWTSWRGIAGRSACPARRSRSERGRASARGGNSLNAPRIDPAVAARNEPLRVRISRPWRAWCARTSEPAWWQRWTGRRCPTGRRSWRNWSPPTTSLRPPVRRTCRDASQGCRPRSARRS